MNTEIVISHLCQSYGRKVVLADVSFTRIPRGCLACSDAMAPEKHIDETLATLLAPKGGSVCYAESPYRKACGQEMTGYLPQEFSMYPSMTVYEALDYLSVLSGCRSSSGRREFQNSY